VKRLEVALYGGPPQNAPGDVILVPLPENERPLREDAGIVDWRLCGEISRLISARFCSGTFGEATLLPAGGGLAARRVLLFGVGLLEALHGRSLERALTLAGAKLLEIRATSGVLALPEGLDLGRDARAILIGLGRAVAVVHGNARLTIVVPDSDRHGRALRAVWPEVCSELDRFGVEGVMHDLGGAHPRAAEAASVGDIR
jgi:hypothetical protein